MTTYKKGKIVKAAVTGIESYGIFVSLDDYYTGLVHISEISHGFVRNVGDFVKIGDIIYVEVLEVDTKHSQLKLSIKNIDFKKKLVKKKKIVETGSGFGILKENLDAWIKENLESQKNV